MQTSLTDRVAQTLLEEITGGGYRIGEVLPPEQVIAQRLGVSRTILREALARLKVEGILASKQGRGLAVVSNARPLVLRIQQVPEDDADRILGIVELRRGVEIEAAALAAERRTLGDLQAMRDALDRMEHALRSGEIAAGTTADLDFHRSIACATGNEHYRNFFDFLGLLLRRGLEVSRRRSASVDGRERQAQEEHEAVYAAIEMSDPAEARFRARIHVVNTEARLRSLHFLKRDPATRERNEPEGLSAGVLKAAGARSG
jgi:GntR family transcriptional repressor for pyruvate dehydrogenase complex